MTDNTKNTSVQNVLSFEQWRLKQGERTQGQSLTQYLKVLSFHDLVNEYQSIIQELKDFPLNTELTQKSKTILSEFSDRLGEHSIGGSDSLTEMRSKIEKKIFDLNGLL
jgi:nucleoside diphosphate kinase